MASVDFEDGGSAKEDHQIKLISDAGSEDASGGAEDKPGTDHLKVGLKQLATLRSDERVDGQVVKVRRSRLSVNFGAEIDGVLKTADAIQHDEDMRQIFKAGDRICAEVKTVNVGRRRVYLRQLAQATAAKPKMLACRPDSQKSAASPRASQPGCVPRESQPGCVVDAEQSSETAAALGVRSTSLEPGQAPASPAPTPAVPPVPLVPAAKAMFVAETRTKTPKLLTPVAVPPQEGPKEDDRPVQKTKRRVKRRRGEKAAKEAKRAAAKIAPLGDVVKADERKPLEHIEYLPFKAPSGAEEQRRLGHDVRARLKRTAALADHDAETLGELSDLVVMMLLSGKTALEVHSELEGFLCDNTGDFVVWLSAHLQNEV